MHNCRDQSYRYAFLLIFPHEVTNNSFCFSSQPKGFKKKQSFNLPLNDKCVFGSQETWMWLFVNDFSNSLPEHNQNNSKMMHVNQSSQERLLYF